MLFLYFAKSEPSIHFTHEVPMKYRDTIDHYFAGDEDLFRRFTTQFLHATPSLLAEVDKALEEGHSTTAGLHIHTLKGQLHYLGQAALADQLQNAEALADQSKLALLQAEWARLRPDINFLLKKLNLFLK